MANLHSKPFELSKDIHSPLLARYESEEEYIEKNYENENQENRILTESTTTTTDKATIKMNPEELLAEFFCPLITSGEFNLEDFFLNGTSEPNSMVQPDFDNISLEEPEYIPTDNILDDIIPSPESINMSEPSCELNQFYFENYIDLAAFESGSLSTDLALSNVFSDINEVQNTTITLDEILPTKMITIDETDSLVPELPVEIYAMLDGSNTDETVVQLPNLELELATKLDPSMMTLLQTFENSIANENVAMNTDELPAKKAKLEEDSSTLDNKTPNKLIVRRLKNNEASKVCRATRKAKHQELFDCEQQLTKENKELNCEVEELTRKVEYLRSYLVQKLSTQAQAN